MPTRALTRGCVVRGVGHARCVVPTLADIEAARPRCQAKRKEPGVVRVNFGLRGGTTRQTIEVLCLKPMRYRTIDNTWTCECGSVEIGEVFGARAAAFTEAEPLAA